MLEGANRFTGSVPENYDKGLGPHIFADYADDIAGRAAAAARDHVLELAAGTGIVSRRLRDLLPAGVRLTVTDLNPPMLEVARRKFGDGENVAFAPADALALPYDDGDFDLVVCQFGVMFFPDKVASFREAARVLKPGGRYIFSTWAEMAANPFSEVTHRVAARFFPDDPPGFYRVPFSYPDPAAVRADLEAAGWRDVEAATVSLRTRVADPLLFAGGLIYGNPIIDEIRNHSGAAPEAVVEALAAALTAQFGPAPFTMPLRATLFEAQRS